LKRRRKAGAWLSQLATLVLIGTFLFAVFVGYGLVNNRWYHVVVIEGGSMQPALSAGDALVITPPPEKLEPGMIVTMNIEGQLVTHRVVSVTPFVTKGDANSANDQWEQEKIEVVGIVRFKLPKFGWLLQKLRLADSLSSHAYLTSRDKISGQLEAGANFQTAESALDPTLLAPPPLEDFLGGVDPPPTDPPPTELSPEEPAPSEPPATAPPGVDPTVESPGGSTQPGQEE
jgi:signal peptidase I